jgi:hypothetical protein
VGLAGHTIGVPAGSVFEASLAALKLPDLKVAVVPPPAQQADLLADVSRGDRPLTVVDSNILPTEEPFAPAAVRLFDVPRAALHELWQLLAAANLPRCLVAHRPATVAGDSTRPQRDLLETLAPHRLHRIPPELTHRADDRHAGGSSTRASPRSTRRP